MTQPGEIASASSHRGRRKASSVVLPVVFALSLVLVGFLAVWAWIGVGEDPNGVAAPVTSGSSSSLDGSVPRDTPSPSSSPSRAPSRTPSPSATNRPSKSPKPKPSAVRAVPVVVFNQTSTPGLAARFAALLEQRGWNVVGIDNWVGTVPAPTVYYRPGAEAAARTLRRDFPAVGRIRPAVTPMPPRALTVILTAGFTG